MNHKSHPDVPAKFYLGKNKFSVSACQCLDPTMTTSISTTTLTTTTTNACNIDQDCEGAHKYCNNGTCYCLLGFYEDANTGDCEVVTGR